MCERKKIGGRICNELFVVVSLLLRVLACYYKIRTKKHRRLETSRLNRRLFYSTGSWPRALSSFVSSRLYERIRRCLFLRVGSSDVRVVKSSSSYKTFPVNAPWKILIGWRQKRGPTSVKERPEETPFSMLLKFALTSFPSGWTI